MTQVVTISTHVLNTATGKPQKGVPVKLEVLTGNGSTWDQVSAESIETNSDGRIDSPFKHTLAVNENTATFRLRFETKDASVFYPYVEIVFVVQRTTGEDKQHLHIPLLLSPYAYSTYRGS
ncbi:hydroxyisourate hydrolase [Rhizoclosmatium globosum]|uniref:5-hydroxyisourate hydrolase n=1 Tax=Rhizoclosmatium globosum TaxID=329046 RepID=A0A1Y2BZ04_9FUNG|nr:hydroxyisourate hydrolase [Rhizoclosmatium globosum]|eukprot:ORY39999.1 hydroxyisourate hydrolase [Rhizoclosmatium globosum]